MAITWENIREKVPCATCRLAGSLSKGHVNLLALRRRATWASPVSANVLTGEYGVAVSIVCDRCIKKPVTHAVEFRGETVVFHPLEELELLGPEQSHLILEGGRGITCLVCGTTSWHLYDVKKRWCPNCEKFHPIESPSNVAF